MNDSLFDTKFTPNEPQGEAIQPILDANTNNSPTENLSQQQQPEIIENDASAAKNVSTTLPAVHDKSQASALINYRVLVSAKEAGCLIGQNGSVIDSIRSDTNTKAGISKLQPGSHERILTVSGTLDDCAKALSYFAQALCNSASSTQETYSYFPLKQLSSHANIEGETTILRLLIPNSQMGTLIGSKGMRIQQIQSEFNISMIASKSFLPGSNERLVELQGTVNNLYDSLRVISRCLIEDFSSIVGTNYYTPRGYNYQNGANSNGNGTNSANSRFRKTTTIGFPNEIVGALIGKNGSRIQGVRKLSGATIGISDEVEGQTERIFTISGTAAAVEKAKGLLYHNLDREEQRRREQVQE
jgi:heterogeneous nuclear rnp K-like protein 2